MRFRLLVFAAILFSTQAFSQTSEDNGCSVWLNAGSGLNIIQSIDEGASPLSYFGVGANFAPGATVEWKRFYCQFEPRVSGNLCFNNSDQQAFEIDIDVRSELLYRVHDAYNNRLHFWAGGLVQSFTNIKYYPQLMNAALGISSYTNLDASGMVQYDFAPVLNNEHHLFTTYAKLVLPLFGWAKRPGFSYIGNATVEQGLDHLLKEREKFFKWFPGASTEIGLLCNLPNKNKVGVNYRWDYLTTRHKGSHRSDHAIHSFNLTFMFNII